MHVTCRLRMPHNAIWLSCSSAAWDQLLWLKDMLLEDKPTDWDHLFPGTGWWYDLMSPPKSVLGRLLESCWSGSKVGCLFFYDPANMGSYLGIHLWIEGSFHFQTYLTPSLPDMKTHPLKSLKSSSWSHPLRVDENRRFAGQAFDFSKLPPKCILEGLASLLWEMQG